MTAREDTGRGALATGGAFALWGLFPLYWKLLESLPATEQLAHRIAWSLPCLGVLLLLRRSGRDLRGVLRSRRTIFTLLATTTLIAGNWLTFLWAVSHDHVLDASLGYYINPLVSVLLGFVFLGERLRRPQWVAVALAGVGVLVLTARHGLPWVSLALAFSFGLYGLLRKVVDAPAMIGLFVEVALLTPLAGAHLVWLGAEGTGAFASGDIARDVLLVSAGPVTVVPLLLFNYGVRGLTLATVGVLQYLAPPGHFVLAVFVYREPFGTTHLVAFAFLWTALALYTADLRRTLARGRRPPSG